MEPEILRYWRFQKKFHATILANHKNLQEISIEGLSLLGSLEDPDLTQGFDPEKLKKVIEDTKKGIITAEEAIVISEKQIVYYERLFGGLLGNIEKN